MNFKKENPFSVSLRVEDLLPLISSKTRIIAMTATSNILGEIIDIPTVVKAIRADAKAKGAGNVMIVVDSVAYAPHRFIDVQAFDADFVAFSYYKVFQVSVLLYQHLLFPKGLRPTRDSNVGSNKRSGNTTFVGTLLYRTDRRITLRTGHTVSARHNELRDDLWNHCSGSVYCFVGWKH